MHSISPPTERRADRAIQIMHFIAQNAKNNSCITPLTVIQAASAMAASANTANDIAQAFEYLQTH